MVYKSPAMYRLSRQELNRLSECVKILEWLRETDHAHLLGHTQLGTCLMKMKDYARAREVLTSVLEVDPDHLMALQNYGETEYCHTFCHLQTFLLFAIKFQVHWLLSYVIRERFFSCLWSRTPTRLCSVYTPCFKFASYSNP